MLTYIKSVAVAGHSFGADIAVIALAALAGKIGALIAIDPVGSAGYRSHLEKVAAKSSVWVNVNATGGIWMARSNFIAGLDGAYNATPSNFERNNYDDSNSIHSDFAGMMGMSCKNKSKLRVF